VPDLAPTTVPRLGTNYVLTASNGAFNGVGLIVHGLSNLNSSFGPLPVDLTAVGFAGCRLQVSLDASLLLVLIGGAGMQSAAVPNNAALGGMQLFSQVLVLDQVAPNGNGGVSNAVHAVLGS
jgi:hypothetical protein